MKKIPRSTAPRAPLPVEQGSFESKPFIMDGKPTTVKVSEKMGKDGVIETHVNYTRVPKTRPKSYPRAMIKFRWCPDCNAEIISNFKDRPHKFPCVPKRKRCRK